MAFRFAARTLLELGRELISSDEVALYELIKNAVDAGSARVEIIAEVVLPHSAYRAALESLDDGIATRVVIASIRAHLLPGSAPDITSRFMAPMRQAIGRPERFRDALRAVYRQFNWIEIRDAGHGMSLEELNDVYLTVGTRSRRAANVSGSQYLGDKGVGRLSAMRLGDHLAVATTRAGEARWNVLKVNWSLFTHETEIEIGDIDVKPIYGLRKTSPDEHGTKVRISSLTGEWNFVRFEDILQGRISRMVDPFAPGRANKLLVVRHNGSRVAIPSIEQSLLSSAHASCHASLTFAAGEPIFEGTINYRLRQKERQIAQRGAEVYSIAQNVWRRRGKKGHAATTSVPIRPKALRELGPFEVDIYWYNRRVVEAVEGLTENVQQTRTEIARWSGGPMLYRHGFRILPYGDPDDDWLELDRNAFGQQGFKLNRQQVIGRVRVHSAHTALSEQTNREGLVQSDAADALRTLLMWLLHGEMRELINEADKVEQLSRREAERVAYDFRNTQKLVEESLEALRFRIGPEQKSFVDVLASRVTALADQCEALVGKTNKVVEETVEEREKFVHLAGIGLMTEFIFHELDRSVEHTIRALSQVQGANRDATLRSLEDQLATLQKRISAFDEMSGERRQTKSTFDLVDIVKLVVANHANQFARHHIRVVFDPPVGGLRIKAVRGMIIQIIENLVANSVYWLKQQLRYQEGFAPEIVIDIDPHTQSLTVEDNGPGIDPRRRDVIFQPFITSKPAGQGRGLGLYISRELAQYHGWQLYLEQEVGRKRPGRLSLFVLDMDDSK